MLTFRSHLVVEDEDGEDGGLGDDGDEGGDEPGDEKVGD